MGQIVIAGIYRQQGPNGGELTAIDKLDYLAELIETPGGQSSQVIIWQPGDRR